MKYEMSTERHEAIGKLIEILMSPIRARTSLTNDVEEAIKLEGRTLTREETDALVSRHVSNGNIIEAMATAFLGSKHASIVDTLGIPRREVAKRLGFNNYSSLRKEKEMEDNKYPEMPVLMDPEAAQESQEAEPSKKTKEDKQKKKESKPAQPKKSEKVKK